MACGTCGTEHPTEYPHRADVAPCVAGLRARIAELEAKLQPGALLDALMAETRRREGAAQHSCSGYRWEAAARDAAEAPSEAPPTATPEGT